MLTVGLILKVLGGAMLPEVDRLHNYPTLREIDLHWYVLAVSVRPIRIEGIAKITSIFHSTAKSLLYSESCTIITSLSEDYWSLKVKGEFELLEYRVANLIIRIHQGFPIPWLRRVDRH